MSMDTNVCVRACDKCTQQHQVLGPERTMDELHGVRGRVRNCTDGDEMEIGVVAVMTTVDCPFVKS